MKWIENKKDKGQVGNVTYLIERTDRGARTVRFILDGKEVLMCGMGSYSDFTVNIPAPPEMKEAWVLHGKCLGIEVREIFDYDFDAKERKRKLDLASDDESELKITKEKVPVEIEPEDEVQEAA